MKKVVYRMTENDLHKIIEESVKKALNEIGDTEKGQYMLGRLTRKHRDNGELQKMKNVSDYSHEKIKDAFNNYPHYNPNKGHHLSNANSMGWHDKGKENMEECSSTLNEIGDTEKGQGEKGSAEGFEKGSKLRNAYHKGREYGKSSVKESSKQINEMNEGDDLQSMIFNAMKSIDEAIMDCQKGNCKAAMFNLPYVKQVLKYLSRTL